MHRPKVGGEGGGEGRKGQLTFAAKRAALDDARRLGASLREFPGRHRLSLASDASVANPGRNTIVQIFMSDESRS